MAKKKARKASQQKKQSCQLIHFVSQHRHTIGLQPEDPCAVNLTDGEADAAPLLVAHQPVSSIAAFANEGTSADALSHSIATTATDDQARGDRFVASAAAPASVSKPGAASAAVHLLAFKLPAAIVEPAELPHLQWPGRFAHPAAELVPVNSLSVDGRLPPDPRAEAAHVAPEGPSATKELEDVAAVCLLPEASVDVPAPLAQLQWPALSAHPDAVLALAVFPVPAGSLPHGLQAEEAHTAPSKHSVVTECEAAAPAAATNALMLQETEPQLRLPVLSAHPPAVLAPAGFPQSAGRLPPQLQAEADLTSPETNRSIAPASSTSQQLSPVAVAVVDSVCSLEQHSGLAQADQADADDQLATLNHDTSWQAPALSGRLQV